MRGKESRSQWTIRSHCRSTSIGLKAPAEDEALTIFSRIYGRRSTLIRKRGRSRSSPQCDVIKVP